MFQRFLESFLPEWILGQTALTLLVPLGQVSGTYPRSDKKPSTEGCVSGFPGPAGTGGGCWELREAQPPRVEEAMELCCGEGRGPGGWGNSCCIGWSEVRLSQGTHAARCSPSTEGMLAGQGSIIATPDLEVGAQVLLLIATTLCSLWTLLSSSWPKEQKEE